MTSLLISLRGDFSLEGLKLTLILGGVSSVSLVAYSELKKSGLLPALLGGGRRLQ